MVVSIATPGDMFLIWISLLNLAFAAVAIKKWFFGKPRVRFLALLPVGIVCTTQRGGSGLITWEYVAGASAHPLKRGVEIRIKIRPSGIKIIPRDIAAVMDADDVIGRIETHVAKQ